MISELDWLRAFRDELNSRIQTKTGWGKNELKDEIDRVYVKMIEKMIDPQQPENDSN